jgi:hypothetical protein
MKTGMSVINTVTDKFVNCFRVFFNSKYLGEKFIVQARKNKRTDRFVAIKSGTNYTLRGMILCIDMGSRM